MTMNTVRKQIKDIYDEKCNGNDGVIDKCNCYLHSYTSKNNGNDFIDLEPFIKFVEDNHNCDIPLTCQLLKSYAKNYINNDDLSFEDCNWF